MDKFKRTFVNDLNLVVWFNAGLSERKIMNRVPTWVVILAGLLIFYIIIIVTFFALSSFKL